jgi:hypothetical protein
MTSTKRSPLLGLAVASLLTAGFACNAPSKRAETPLTTQPAAALAVNDALLASLKRDLTYIASDELEGRGTGTKGIETAAGFIEQRFKALGLKPLAGVNGYQYPFEVTVGMEIDETSALAINGEALKLGTDFTPLGFSGNGEVKGDVVFAGYAIDSDRYIYSDFDKVDVKGKIVLAMRYEPHTADGKSRFTGDTNSRESVLSAKVRAAINNGAAGVILVNPPKFHGDKDELIPFNRSQGGRMGVPVYSVTQAVANKLLAAGGVKETLAELQAKIDGNGKPASVELKGVTLAGKAGVKPRKVTAHDVVAVLPGSGPLKDEYVVIGAHYDHLGRGGQGSLSPNSTEIHNGADDNGSGTTAILALAEAMSKQKDRVGRSVIFMTFAGEELGLLGSDAFVKNPPIPLTQIASMLNLDMVGRIRNQMLYVGGGGTAAAFESMLQGADDRSPLVLKSIGRGGRGPSDHASFSRVKIPVIFLFSGLHDDYHRPTDDVEKINFDGIASATALAYDLAQQLVTQPRQAYVDKYDNEPVDVNVGRERRPASRPASGPATQRATTGAAPSTGPAASNDQRNDDSPRMGGVRLGVEPDYSAAESTTGVKITGAAANSPAAKAGLKAGDTIVKMGSIKVDNLYDMMEALRGANPGDKMKIVVLRDGKPVELTATLEARGGQ